MRSGRRRITKALAAVVGIALLVVMSRHERPSFELDRELAERGKGPAPDPPHPQTPGA